MFPGQLATDYVTTRRRRIAGDPVRDVDCVQHMYTYSCPISLYVEAESRAHGSRRCADPLKTLGLWCVEEEEVSGV